MATEPEQRGGIRWAFKVATNLHFAPTPPARVIERTVYEDHAEYVVEIAPTTTEPA